MTETGCVLSEDSMSRGAWRQPVNLSIPQSQPTVTVDAADPLTPDLSVQKDIPDTEVAVRPCAARPRKDER